MVEAGTIAGQRSTDGLSRGERMSMACLGALLLSLLLTLVVPVRPRLVWNMTASAPIGLYATGSVGKIARGEMVLADMPEAWRLLAARRAYIPIGVPLVKRVAALKGDRVCALGQQITINGAQAAERHARDRRGRLLPWWTGCRTVTGDEAFLLMDHPDSFDGRYFGITPGAMILGRARLLWAR